MKFAIGELVILQNATYFDEWNGAVGRILGLLELRCAMDMHTMETEWLHRYSVLPLVEGGFRVFCCESQLRKLTDSEFIAANRVRETVHGDATETPG